MTDTLQEVDPIEHALAVFEERLNDCVTTHMLSIELEMAMANTELFTDVVRDTIRNEIDNRLLSLSEALDKRPDRSGIAALRTEMQQAQQNIQVGVGQIFGTKEFYDCDDYWTSHSLLDTAITARNAMVMVAKANKKIAALELAIAALQETKET